MQYISVALGGALGALMRYSTSKIVAHYTSTHFPLSTFIVNVIGSFLIVLLFAISLKTNITSQMRLFLFTGFLGSFTTFSTFSLATVELVRSGHYTSAMVNAFGSLIIGCIAVLLGMIVVR